MFTRIAKSNKQLCPDCGKEMTFERSSHNWFCGNVHCVRSGFTEESDYE